MYRAALALSPRRPGRHLSTRGARWRWHPQDDAPAPGRCGRAGRAAAWSTGDLAGAHAAYTDSVAELRQAGLLADVLGLHITLGDIRRHPGPARRRAAHLPATRSTSTATADGARRCAEPPTCTSASPASCWSATTSPAPRASWPPATRLGEHNGLPQNPYRSRVVHALGCARPKATSTPRSSCSTRRSGSTSATTPRTCGRCRRCEPGCGCAAASSAHAEAWARERHLAPDDELSYLREYEHLTLARLLLARHQAGGAHTAAGGSPPLDEATGLLQRLAAAAETGGRVRPLIEILALLAHAHGGARRARHRPEDLAAGGELAEPERYVRVFTGQGPA